MSETDRQDVAAIIQAAREHADPVEVDPTQPMRQVFVVPDGARLEVVEPADRQGVPRNAGGQRALMSWADVRRAFRGAARQADPWAGAHGARQLGGVRAFHAPAEDHPDRFAAVVVTLDTDGVLTALWIDGHPYIFRHGDLTRLIRAGAGMCR